MKKASEILGAISNVKPKDENCTIPSKNIFEKDFKNLDNESQKLFYNIDRNLKKNGLDGLDVKKMQGREKWTHADGSKNSIFRIRKGKIRLLLSFIVDDPESLLQKPVFYLHAVFVKKKEGNAQYRSFLNRITKQKIESYEFEEIPTSNIKPEKCLNEVWKTKEMYPYTPIDQEDYHNLKLLSQNSEMAVSPTDDQIKAIYESERPLFINGQAGTGKTTGISFLLCLAIPGALTKPNTPRTLVTAMTETVVKKLENNTHQMFEAHHQKLEQIFDLQDDSIINFINKSKSNKNKWYQGGQIGQSGDSNGNEGSKLSFIDFKTILQDIIQLSIDDILSETNKLEALIKNPKKCDEAFDINNQNSIKNRKVTCEYCSDNPKFHHNWKNTDFNDPNKTRVLRLFDRLNNLKKIILSKNVPSNVTYSQFLLEFFGPRSNDFNILPEFAWYGIRTLIKGNSVRNNFQYLSKDKFEELVDDSSKGDFEGKTEDLFDCYEKYEQWLKQNQRRDDIDVATDAAYLLNTFKDLLPSRFDRLYLDEAQDLTPVEYNVLMLLLNNGYENEIVLAGDPLQTINPTGFDWDRIKDLMYSSLGRKPQNPHVLNHNWRAPRSIVEISNGILDLRRKILQGESVEHQQAHEPGPKPVLLFLKSKDGSSSVDLENLADFMMAKTNYKVAVRKSDQKGLEDLIQNDDLLRDYIDANENNFYTVTEIKGDEGETIILYRTGEMRGLDLNHLLSKDEELKHIDKETQIQLKFIINQLYILTTRSSRQLYIIETDRHKGRFWTGLFPDLIEIDDAPNDLLHKIITTADENFELGEWLDSMIKKWGEENNPKFLKWAISKCKDILRKRKLTPTERNKYNRIVALNAEFEEDFEKAGDSWLKIQENRKAFNCFINAKCWKKARSTKVVDAREYSLILDYLEDKDMLKSRNLRGLLELCIRKFNSDQQIPDWFGNIELELTQFLLDSVVYLYQKEDGKDSISLVDLSPLRLLGEAKIESLDETLELLKRTNRVEKLRALLNDINSFSIRIDTTEYMIFCLKKDIMKTEDYSFAQSELLVQILNLGKLDKRSRRKFWKMLACNILESMEIDSESRTLPHSLNTAMRDNCLDTSHKHDQFIKTAPGTGVEDIRNLLILIRDDTTSFPEREIVPSLAHTYSLIEDLNSDKRNNDLTNFRSEFGSKTLDYLSSEGVQSIIRKRVIADLRKSTAEELVNDKSMIDCYKSFKWEVDEWAKQFANIYPDVEENSLNRTIIDKWRNWFRGQLSDKNEYSNSETQHIIKSIIESEKLWILESDAKLSENQHLVERLEMEKIRQSDEMDEEKLLLAHKWFTDNNMPTSANELLSRLPNTMSKEIENSLGLEIKPFSELVATISAEGTTDEIKAICGKIIQHKKRFRLIDHLSESDIISLSKQLSQDTDIGEFFYYYTNQRYELFRHYAHNDNPVRVIRAVMKLANQIKANLQQQLDIGQHYLFIEERWKMYEEEDDFGRIFTESAVCSIVAQVMGQKMTIPRLKKFSVEINSAEISTSKKADMVNSIIATFNNKLSIKCDAEFMERISEHI